MEQILAHPQLFSNLGIASVLLIFIFYLIQSHKEREKFWTEKFENSYVDLKDKLDNIYMKVEMNYELVSQSMKHYQEHTQQFRQDMLDRIDAIKHSE